MMKGYFVKQAIKEVEIENFIKENFPMGDYSRTELQRTPLGIKIVIYTNKPGRIIGKGGKNINDMTEAIKHRFGLENPQLDVKIIRNPNLDPQIVAKQIASALERGYNHKKIGNLTLKRIMESGALGAQITISGIFGSGKGMKSKFMEGYLKHCGQPAKELVLYGFEEARTKRCKIGIKVKIMTHYMGPDGIIKSKKDLQGEELAKVMEGLEPGSEGEKKEVAEKESKKKDAAKKPEKKKKESKKPKEKVQKAKK